MTPKMLDANNSPTPKDSIRCAIYTRVSTNYQIDKESLPVQRRELIAYCELLLGTTNYEIFEDAGYSGKNTARPAYRRMLEGLRARKFTHLLVWKIDRISRNLLDFSALYSELKNLNVTFISKNEQFDTSTAIGGAMLKIILVFAELEREMTSERVSAIMLNRAENGQWNGSRVPFGYILNEDKSFSLHPEQAALIARIFSLYAECGSTLQVSRILSAEGIPGPRSPFWQFGKVRDTLRNAWYIGTYKYTPHKTNEPIIIKNHHPPIVTEDLFYTVQDILDKNAESKNRQGRRVFNSVPRIFDKLVFCTICNARCYAAVKRNSRNQSHCRYICKSYNSNGDCPSSSQASDYVLGEFLINFIINILHLQDIFYPGMPIDGVQLALLRGSVFSSVDCIDQASLAALYNVLSTGPEGVEFLARSPIPIGAPAPVDSVKLLQTEQEKLNKALEKLTHIYLYCDGDISDADFVSERNKILLALDEVNAKMEAAEHIEADYVDDSEYIDLASTFILENSLRDKDYICFKQLMREISHEVLERFFHTVLSSVYLSRQKIVSITFKNGITHHFHYKPL